MNTPTSNRSAEGLFLAAQEAAVAAASQSFKHREALHRALQSTMELVEFGDEHPTALEACLSKRKSRAGLDVIARVVKVVFPNASSQSRNTYANALRHAQRHKHSAEHLPDFLAEVTIEKAAKDERDAQRGAATKPKPQFQPFHVEALPGVPKERDRFTVTVERDEKGFNILLPKKWPKARAARNAASPA
jgi:hypothetical protein